MLSGLIQRCRDYQIRQVLPDSASGACYYRLQTALQPIAEAMDDVSSANMERLKNAGTAIVQTHSPAFQQLCMQLGPGGARLAAATSPPRTG